MSKKIASEKTSQPTIKWTVETLSIADLDRSLQPREVSQETIDQYAAAMKQGTEFPRPHVFREPETGTLYLAAGYHRIAAMVQNEKTEVECAVSVGTRKEARLYACRDNVRHGKALSVADRRRIVAILFEEVPESREWGSRKVAAYFNNAVSHTTVCEVKKECGYAEPVSPDSPKSKGKGKKAKAKEGEASATPPSVEDKPSEAKPSEPELDLSKLDQDDGEKESTSAAETTKETAAVESGNDDTASTEEAERPTAEPSPEAEDEVELCEGVPATAWKVLVCDDRVTLSVITAAGTEILIESRITRRTVARKAAPIAAE